MTERVEGESIKDEKHWLVDLVSRYGILLSQKEADTLELIANKFMGTVEEEDPTIPMSSYNISTCSSRILYNEIRYILNHLQTSERISEKLEDDNVFLRQKHNEVSNLLHIQNIPGLRNQYQSSLRAHVFPEYSTPSAKKLLKVATRDENSARLSTN
jgi:hypothetical protein